MEIIAFKHCSLRQLNQQIQVEVARQIKQRFDVIQDDGGQLVKPYNFNSQNLMKIVPYKLSLPTLKMLEVEGRQLFGGVCNLIDYQVWYEREKIAKLRVFEATGLKVTQFKTLEKSETSTQFKMPQMERVQK